MKYLKHALVLLSLSLFPLAGFSQYYQIANQLPGLIQPALSGGSGYRGFVDASYLAGVGDRRVDFAGVSTSQGFNYRSWFYMGVGIGIDVAMGHTDPGFAPAESTPGGYWNHGYTKTGVMIPIFTDFRFNIGNTSGPSFYIDARIGASFLMGDDYLTVADGFITNRQYFYLRPSVGIRIPVNKTGKQAVDIGAVYQLLTSNYWYTGPYSNSSTLSALGAVVAFEW